jgi:hypothetical protein
LARRPFKVAAVALVNKTARVAWALLARGGTYRAPAIAAGLRGSGINHNELQTLRAPPHLARLRRWMGYSESATSSGSRESAERLFGATKKVCY